MSPALHHYFRVWNRQRNYGGTHSEIEAQEERLMKIMDRFSAEWSRRERQQQRQAAARAGRKGATAGGAPQRRRGRR